MRRQLKANTDLRVTWKGQLLKQYVSMGFSMEMWTEKTDNSPGGKSAYDARSESASLSRRKKSQCRKQRSSHRCGRTAGKAASLEARKEGKSWRAAQGSLHLGAMLHVMELREAEASVREVGVSLVALVAKNPSANRCPRQGFSPWVRKSPWRRAWQPTPVFLPGESHGQESLAGYSPWGHKDSDMTEAT